MLPASIWKGYETKCNCRGMPVIPHIDEDRTISEAKDCNGTESNFSCAFFCKSNYVPTSQAMCVNGQWATESAYCTDTCTRPASSGVDFGSEVSLNIISFEVNISEFKCKTGWSGSVSNVSVCNGLSSTYIVNNTCMQDPCANDPIVEDIDKEKTHCEGTEGGASCSIACQKSENGERQDPSEQAKCEAGKWVNDGKEGTGSLKCEQAGCKSDPHYSNIDRERTKCENTRSGMLCEYFCKAGYEATGVAKCTKGVWDDRSYCKERKCESISSLETPGNIVPGNIVPNAVSIEECDEDSQSCNNITCVDGHTLKGSESKIKLKCKLGKWTVSDDADAPQCEANPCEKLPDNILHMKDENECMNTPGFEGNGPKKLNVCEISCESGYVPTGPAICEAGNWAKLPTCTSECRKPENVIGYDPSQITETTMTQGKDFNVTGWKCALGYTGTAKATTCTDKSDKYKLNGCEPEECKANPTITKDHLKGFHAPCKQNKAYENGQRCSYSCMDGFTPMGEATCHLGNWILRLFSADDDKAVEDTQNQAWCEAKCNASDLSGDIDATKSKNACDDTDSGNLVPCKYYCNSGLVPTGSGGFCRNGEWRTSSQSACTDTCTSPANFPRGYVKNQAQIEKIQGREIVVMRKDTFEMSVTRTDENGLTYKNAIPYWICSVGYRSDPGTWPEAVACNGDSSEYTLEGCSPIPCPHGNVDFDTSPGMPICTCEEGYNGGGPLVRHKPGDALSDHYPACEIADIKTSGEKKKEECVPSENVACLVKYSDDECSLNKVEETILINLNTCVKTRGKEKAYTVSTCEHGKLWVQKYSGECSGDNKMGKLLSTQANICRSKREYKCSMSFTEDPNLTLSRGSRTAGYVLTGWAARLIAAVYMTEWIANREFR